MHSSTKKLFAALLAALMVLAVLPVASLAEGMISARTELRSAQRWDNVWEMLDAVENDMIAAGATPAEITYAVYRAALNCPLIDKGSISDLDDNGFSFTTNGMHGGYDYKIRNTAHKPAVTAETYNAITEAYEATIRVNGTKNAPGANNVLLVGPWYSQDSSFTDQYKTESSSLASDLGGTCTQLVNSNATGPAVASAHLNKAIIIYDSHGASYNSTSYLCLTTSTGLTTSDYNNGYAYNGGSWYGIDGRYVQNHIGGTMSNSMVWMAMCEGMKLSGGGKTGTGLLAAGAAVVYGYSQSVSFTGDYKYEAYFWDQMRDGKTVAQAFANMTSKYGNWDPAYSSSSGAAWPIVMSPVDSYPSNPDSHQTVYCDWTMFPETASSPVALTSVSVNAVSVKVGGTANVVVNVQPTTNVDYTIQSYASSNTSIATVSSSGVVTGKAAGTATLTVKVKDNVANTTYTKTATITVSEFTGYTLVSAPVSGGQYIIVGSGYAVGNTIYSNNHYLTAYAVTVNSDNTLTIPSSVTVNNILWTCGGNSTSGWTFKNVGNSKYMGLDSSQYLYPSDTSVAWTYDGTDLNNQVDSDGYYYLSIGSSNAYFTTSKSTGNNIQFYQYVSGSSTPTATPTAAPTATPTAAPTATPTAAPTATPTAAPTATPTPAPTATPTAAPTATPAAGSTYYVPTTTIETGVEYLIGYTDGTNTYLLMNYNPNKISNNYYYSSSSNYYGYGIKAQMSGNNVVGVDTSTYSSATLSNVEWKFVENGSYYKIQSGYNSSYYLRVYSSSSYADLYAASGTSYATNWSWNASTQRLSYYVSSSVTKYATFIPTAGSYSNFFGAPTSATSYSTITLYKKVSGTVTPTAAPTATPTAAPTATPTAAPTATPAPSTGTYYTPVTSITTGTEYLIGYTDGTNTYLLMNYCPDASNHYYYSSSSNYYGYAVRAIMDGNNVVGVDTTTMTSATLDHVEWKFVSNGSYYKIQSAYNSSYYLRVYKSSSYADCYPASGTSYATNWKYSNNMLSYYVSSSLTKYMTFVTGAADDYGFFGATTSGVNIILFKKVG
jgi:hypothetical protein